MTVDYIHYRLLYSEMALLGNLPTFFYFGITLLPLKKKVSSLFENDEMTVNVLLNVAKK